MRLSTLAAPTPDLDDSVPRLLADENGTLLYLNAAFERLSGVRQNGHRLSLIDLFHFEDPDEAFRGAVVAGQPILRNLRGGAHDVYFDHSGDATSLHFDWIQMPGAGRMLVASADAHKASIDNIQQWLHQKPAPAQNAPFSEDLFQSLSRDAMIVFDDLGTILDANAAFTELFAAGQWQGALFLDFVAQEQRAEIRSIFNDLIRNPAPGNIIQFDCRMKGITGQSVVMEWSCRTLQGHFYALGRDVTALKRSESAMTRQQDQLREAEAIGGIGHWYWKLGQDDILFSHGMFRMFGVDENNFKPTLDFVNDFVHRRDIGRMMRAFQRAIIEQNDHDIDFRIRRPDGTICHLRCRGRCKLDGDGDVIALFGVMQDISDRIAHEDDLRKAKDEAEHAYATKSQFLANMSHELRTPLNAIIGFSEILERQMFGPLGNDKYVGYTKGIRESGEHLLDLITDILDMSKIEAGQYKLTLEKVSMERILHTAIHMMEGRALDRQIKINLSMDKNQKDTTADKRAIMQVVLNVLSNAVKFSHPGGRVQVQYLDRGDYLSLRISDEGIGIPANKLPYIAKPFEQVSNQYNRSHEGSGLGLAITKELVGLHGGTFHIESTLGRGTSVTIRLPFQPDV